MKNELEKLKAVIGRSENVAWRRRTGDEVVLFRLDQIDDQFVLDGVSADLWEAFDGKTRFDSLVRTIASKSGWAPEDMRSNAWKLALELKSHGLIEIR